VLIAGSTLAVMFSGSRIVGLISLGVIGFAIAVLYVLHGAPDLALTQIVVETLTVVLFMLVIARLPNFSLKVKRSERFGDLALAGTGGVMMTLLVLKAQGVMLGESISDGFAQMSYALGHGRNVVNVILVDFRGLDTMGEITVLTIAAVGIFALMRGDKSDPSDFGK
jgi:multicomponent Na+:H+ antiporter subunit A